MARRGGGRRGRVEIDWEEVLGPASSPNGEAVDIYFASPSSAPSDDEQRRGAARPRMAPGALHGGLARRGGERRPRTQVDDEARRPVTRAAAKAVNNLAQDASSSAEKAFAFDAADEESEIMAHKFCVKSSPVSIGKKNFNPLQMSKGRSQRPIEQMKTIPTDKMYSSKPCSTTLSGNQQRVHAIDPEESDHEKCQQSGNPSLYSFTKRRKEMLQDSSSFNFRKVEDVVLLDDEDMQPDNEVNFGMLDKQNEPKIYYPSRDDPEAVELTSSDIKCLDPGVYLSSPVINYYIQYIKRYRLHTEDCREKFYIFNTYFYGKLEEELYGNRMGDFSKLRRWWKGVNIFHRAYIILPIHGMAHWSLVIICIPAKESTSGPIILHLDSLGMHPSAKIFNTVGRYLEQEWFHLKQNPSLDTSISETVWEDLPSNIHMEKVQVPQQNNEYDCGIFMLYYIDQFIKGAPERFTREKLAMFSRCWFKSEDASELRQRIRELLLEEFESARMNDALSDMDASDGSDVEDSIKGGELESDAPSDSSEMVVEVGGISKSSEGIKVSASEESEARGELGDAGKSNNEGINAAASDEASGESGDAGKSNEGIVVAASEASVEFGYSSKSNEGVTEVVGLDEAPTSSYKRDEKTALCVLSEAATFSDGIRDEVDPPKAESASPKPEMELFEISSPERSKNDEGVTHSTPIPDVVCDSCDSDTEEVQIVRVCNRGPRRQNCWMS